MEEKQKKPETIYITEEELSVTPPVTSGPGMAGTVAAQPAVRLCPNCQRQVTQDMTFCQACGYGPLRPTTSYEVKKKGTAALLAIIPAIFGFFGIAHFYLEKIGSGFMFLFGGWALAAGALLCWLMAGEWIWAIVLAVIYLGVLVWQVFDAVDIAEENYRVLETA